MKKNCSKRVKLVELKRFVKKLHQLLCKNYLRSCIFYIFYKFSGDIPAEKIPQITLNFHGSTANVQVFLNIKKIKSFQKNHLLLKILRNFARIVFQLINLIFISVYFF